MNEDYKCAKCNTSVRETVYIPLINLRGKRDIESHRWKDNIKINVAEMNCEVGNRI
jgi:hypothetical protein